MRRGLLRGARTQPLHRLRRFRRVFCGERIEGADCGRIERQKMCAGTGAHRVVQVNSGARRSRLLTMRASVFRQGCLPIVRRIVFTVEHRELVDQLVHGAGCRALLRFGNQLRRIGG